MVTYTEALELQLQNQDFIGRLVILVVFGIVLFFMWLNLQRLQDDMEWKRLRNFIFSYFVYISLPFYPFVLVLMLMPTATMDVLINIVAQFYGVALVVGIVLSIVFFYDLILLFLSYLGDRFNYRRNYIFPKNKGWRK